MTDDQRCATCRYWADGGRPELCIPEHRSLCVLTVTEKGMHSVDWSRAFVQADNGGDAGLITFGDFGCVQWKAKP